jgi:tripartite-type tricarboxylate transporter receptor subunit TctC
MSGHAEIIATIRKIPARRQEEGAMGYTRKPRSVFAGATAIFVAAFVGGAAAQSVEEFYSQKDITLMVGAAVGGSADLFARTIAPYLTKYIPGNPHIIVQNRPGAGGLVVATELQHNAPKDGSFISTLQRNNYTDPLLLTEKVNFDAREISSLGSVAKNQYVLFTYGDKPVTIDDARNREIFVACTGAGSVNSYFPTIVNRFAGTKFKCIPGYEGAEDQNLALERGEAEARAVSYETTLRSKVGQWRDQGKMHYVIQFGFERLEAIKDIPNIMEFVESEEDKQVMRFILAPQEFARPFAAPAGIPEDRLAALRNALAMATKDPGYVADAEKQEVSVDFLGGEELQKLAGEIMTTPPAIIEKAKELMK